MEQQLVRRYRRALLALNARERALAIARIERGWGPSTIAQRLRYRTAAAAGIAAARAVRKLVASMERAGQARPAQCSCAPSDATRFCNVGSR